MGSNKQSNLCSKSVTNRLGFLDKFSESVGFEIDGRGAYPSILGIFVSLLVNIIVLTYFYK